MCLRFALLPVTRLAAWSRLCQREESWKDAEILLLRHQLAVLRRQPGARPKPSQADRSLIAVLLSMIPRDPRASLPMIVTPTGLAHDCAEAHHAQLRLAVPSGQVRRIFKVMGLDRVLSIYPSLAAAPDGEPEAGGAVRPRSAVGGATAQRAARRGGGVRLRIAATAGRTRGRCCLRRR